MKLLNVHLGNVLREWLRRTEPESLVVIDPHLVIITFCPLFDENRNSFDKSWPVGSTPCHHGESLMLHVPSRSVFWGILWKTNGVDPGLTPCPVPGLWGTSQLGTNPFLALQKKKISWSLRMTTPDEMGDTAVQLNHSQQWIFLLL